MSGEGVHIFSNGWEYDCWSSRNCDRCVKEPSCDLIDALFTDSLVENLPNGSVKQETADRLGYKPEYIGVLRWPCAEIEQGLPGEQSVAPPKPAAHVMRDAGAMTLPGLEAGQ